MKKKIMVLAVLAVTASLFAWTRPHNAPPSDLRDAVADNGGFDTAIPVLEDDGNLPIPKAVPPSGATASFKNLYALWIEDDFAYPSDKALVTKEMHRLLNLSTDMAEIIEVRLMLSAKLDRVSQLIEFYQGLAYLNLESLNTKRAAVLAERKLLDARLDKLNR